MHLRMGPVRTLKRDDLAKRKVSPNRQRYFWKILKVGHEHYLKKKLVYLPWTPEEDMRVLNMKEDGFSWEDIHAALPNRSQVLDEDALGQP
jgi:hypothetical protein